MEYLSKKYLAGTPAATLFALPEKVVQFGAGVLLRGLPDYLIDQANRQGIFNGRIVVVKSTDAGDADAFVRQDNLYTVCIRGVEAGQRVARNDISTAISRVLSARQQWAEVLACAANPDIAIVLSNTTEVGIQLVHEDFRQTPPGSFPAKLLAFLEARYRHFRGDRSKGLVIVPTELIPENGMLLESIVLELAHLNGLDYEFLEWLENACTFCNSMVDRIVPGQPAAEKRRQLQAELGYADDLLTVAEPYSFWAIEGDQRVAEVLSFQQVNAHAVVIDPDIDRFRERKLRLLNGAHTLACGLAIAAGFPTVHRAMADPDMAEFIARLTLGEIAPAIPYPLPPGDAETFGRQVLDRFRNPDVEHRWLSITVQYAAKMRMRILPVLQEHYRKTNAPPACIALGFAAFLCFYRQPPHPLQDEKGTYLTELWNRHGAGRIVDKALSDHQLWGSDLTSLPGFAPLVDQLLRALSQHDTRTVLAQFLTSHESESIANPSRG